MFKLYPRKLIYNIFLDENKTIDARNCPTSEDLVDLSTNSESKNQPKKVISMGMDGHDEFDPVSITPIASSSKSKNRPKRTVFSHNVQVLINSGVRFDKDMDPVVLLSYSPPNEAAEKSHQNSQPVLDSSPKSQQPFISDQSLKSIGKIISKSRERKRHPGSKTAKKRSAKGMS